MIYSNNLHWCSNFRISGLIMNEIYSNNGNEIMMGLK